MFVGPIISVDCALIVTQVDYCVSHVFGDRSDAGVPSRGILQQGDQQGRRASLHGSDVTELFSRI